MNIREKKALKFTIGTILLTLLAAWIAGPWHPSIKIGDFERDLKVKLGLDLQGGSHLIYRANVEELAQADVDDALAGVRDVIEQRVNAFGVSEPIVQTNRVDDEYRVIIELAGVHDPDRAIAIIGETPQLDFRKEVPIEIEADESGQINIDSATEPNFERTELTGRNLRRATVDFDPQFGTPQVNLEFDREGTDLFAELTRESIGQRIAIYLDGVPISAPTVNTVINNGRAVISGGFTVQEARELATRLNAGALPVPIELIGQNTVGPTLGRLSVEQSVAAGIIGLLAVIAWMIIFYRLPGTVAALALIIYAIFFLAIIKLIPVTLTLAGVAGFILSVGMAVDANVLIFERFRENLRLGKNTTYALDNGFKEAWDSIKASNISSLLTALILYGFGTSIIRGFALTFAIGIALSMITAIVVTRNFMIISLISKKLHLPWLLAVKEIK